MLRKGIWNNRKGRVATCLRKYGEKPIEKDLAYSPADMARMYAKGMPVNSTNLVGNFSDGSPNVSWNDLTIDRQRGVDVADIWTASKVAKNKIAKAIKNGKNVNK